MLRLVIPLTLIVALFMSLVAQHAPRSVQPTSIRYPTPLAIAHAESVATPLLTAADTEAALVLGVTSDAETAPRVAPVGRAAGRMAAAVPTRTVNTTGWAVVAYSAARAATTALDVPPSPVDELPDEPEEAVSESVEAAARTLLGPVGTVWQTLNNCGPASVSMVLAYYGYAVSQFQAQTALRPDPTVWGMMPGVVPPYVARFGLQARVLDHGTVEGIKALLDEGVPVIVAQWLTEAEPLPHYRVVVGYDDQAGVFLVNDGVLGFRYAISYPVFVGLWDIYNQMYIPIYRPSAYERLQAVVGERWNRLVTYVAIAHSRPAWDQQVRAGILAQPTSVPLPPQPTTSPPAPLPTAAPTPVAAPAPTVQAPAAEGMARGAVETGTLQGSGGGAFAYYAVSATGGGTLFLEYSPDDAVVARGIGLKIYSADGRLVGEGVNTTGRVGERRVALPAAPGPYRVQIYNYLPDVVLQYRLYWN